MHIGMINPSAVSISRTPCYNDLEIASLVHRALATIQDPGRFGDRKVFIASLWTMMLHIEARIGGTLTCGASLDDFKAVRDEVLGALQILLLRRRSKPTQVEIVPHLVPDGSHDVLLWPDHRQPG